MNRAQIVRPALASAHAKPRRKAKFANDIDLPLPKLFEPAHSSLPEREQLFNLKAKPGYYNAEKKAALLRREKKAPHDELFIDFSRAEVQIELLAGGRPLAQGVWSSQATVNGAPLSATGPWSEVGWEHSAVCDYLEIEQPLANGWKIERQMFLSRQDQFLFLADALLGPGTPAELSYEHGFKLNQGVTTSSTQDTREVLVKADGRARALIAPLACGEWRAELCDGGLTVSDQRLALRSALHGRRLFAPLWIDLNPRRLARPLTWRRLSVGENLALCPRDVAAGYRVQVGKEQWVFYRSLTDFGNRSVLGHNTSYFFVCGRVKKDGDLDPMLEIE